MSEWKLICRVDDIPVLGARRVARAQGLDVAVFRNADDEVFALLKKNVRMRFLLRLLQVNIKLFLMRVII